MSPDGNDLQQRRHVIRNVLRDVGYSDAHVHFDWRLSNHEQLRRWAQDDHPENRPEGPPSHLDVIAFYDDRERNWDTTAFVGELDRLDLIQNKQNGSGRAKELFELTAAPTALFVGDGRADLWLKCWQQQPERVSDIPFSEESLRSKFRRYRRDLEREALARLRGGQRYLFDGVYHARREELVQYLHRGLSKATWLAPAFTKEATKDQYEQERKALSRVAIALMAARILEDKGFFDLSEQTLDAREILHNAEGRANGFFRKVIAEDLAGLDRRLKSRLVDEMLGCLMAYLTGPASFSMVTPEAIGYLYETALTAERKRGEDLELNGIHYTPRSFAQHIVDRIPVEDFRPSERLVLDMACGSGSFLLSATDRLRQLFDPREQDAGADLTQHLRSHVVGNDWDDIALLVVKLVYLLEHWIEYSERRDVPEPSALWNKDALQLSEQDFRGSLPSVIVGNPPFGAAKRGQQLANQFLDKALDLLVPGGFLGMVMPGGFLKMRRQKCPETRARLLRQAELLEVWEAPTYVVGLRAEQETCVIIARKADPTPHGRKPVLFKSTYSRRKPCVRALREQLRSTWTFAATGLAGRPDMPWQEDEDSRIIASPVDSVWRSVDLGRTLSALCVGGTGIDAPLKKARFSSRKERGFVPYMRTQKRLKPFFVMREDWVDDPAPKFRYLDPASAFWPKEGLWPLYDGAKVIVRCDTNRNSKTQIGAAFDDAGVYPEHHFRCVGLRNESDVNPAWVNQLLSSSESRDLLLWLTAILNSPVAHAWVATCSAPRGLRGIVLDTLPLPPRFDRRIPELVEQTSHVRRTVDEDTPLWDPHVGTPPTDFLSLAAQINQRVLASYALKNSQVELLHKYLRGMTEPWVDDPENAHMPLQGATYRRITGTVVAVDVKRQQVTLDIPRYGRKAGGPLKVPLPKHMPGWALRDGVEFTCAAPANRRDPADLQEPWLLRDFRPLPYSYLEPSEIERMAGFQALDATR